MSVTITLDGRIDARYNEIQHSTAQYPVCSLHTSHQTLMSTIAHFEKQFTKTQ